MAASAGEGPRQGVALVTLPPHALAEVQRILNREARRIADEDPTRATSGMTGRDEWEQTDVHRHSRYSCGKCGEGFSSPHEVYKHLDWHRETGE